MKVREAMVTGVITAHPEETVRSVVQRMILRRCGAVPVVSHEGALIGIISVRDIMMPMFAQYSDVFAEDVHAMNFEEMEEEYPHVLSFKASQIMTTNPITVGPDDQVLKAASVMGRMNLRRIPVTENGRLVGIVSVGDIHRTLYMHQDELERRNTSTRSAAA